MMLKQIGMQSLGRIAEFIPRELPAAFGAARFDKPAEVVVAERAQHICFMRNFIRGDGHRIQSTMQIWTLPKQGGRVIAGKRLQEKTRRRRRG